MTSDLAPEPPALDLATLRARVDQRIALLRAWLSHDHHDEPYWWARHTTAPRAQQERQALRGTACLLHIERATQRGRIHCTRFATLDEQRTWLTGHEGIFGTLAAAALGLPSYASLVYLRAGKLPL